MGLVSVENLRRTDRLDLDHDVVLAPAFQSFQLFEKYRTVSVFYQTIQKEDVKVA